MARVTFQRARSDQQREQRREAVLDTAAAMLGEMPVADLTLNELARRVGLAKSNVLRYVESREAVLLALLDRGEREWVAELRAVVGRAGRRGGPALRADRLAAATATTLAARPVLCDLLGAQAAVLERNVPADAAARYKRASLEVVGEVRDVALAVLPELGPRDAFRFAAATLLLAGATWQHAHPAPALAQAYDEHPELAVLRMEHEDVLRQLLEVVLAGLLARSA